MPRNQRQARRADRRKAREEARARGERPIGSKLRKIWDVGKKIPFRPFDGNIVRAGDTIKKVFKK